MTGRRFNGVPFIAVLALALACAPQTDSAPTRPERPNVLVVVVDTLRWDSLGHNGSPRDTSPAVDRFAASALRFERAYSVAPWTMPAVTSMITGLYPSSHGLTEIKRMLPAEATTLAELLTANDYVTGAVISHHLIGAKKGFDQGYRRFVEQESGHKRVSTPWVTTSAVKLLRSLATRKKPFFLFVHYFDPHFNYLPHDEYRYAAERAGTLDGDETIEEVRNRLAELTPEEVTFLRDLYDGEVRYTDDGIGALFDTLDELGIADDTVVVFTADHGEEFMERGWLGHTRTLYDELVHVPLLVRIPGERARSLDTPVSTASLAATILELTGTEVPAHMQVPSFLPVLAGATDGSAFFEVDFVQHPLPAKFGVDPDVVEMKNAHKKGLIVGRHKLIRDDRTNTYELYDLAADPNEQRDLSAELPEVVTSLRERLEETLARAAASTLSAEDAELDEEELERLRKLGYIEGG
jgi:arylsulfatase A-like enzyme